MPIDQLFTFAQTSGGEPSTEITGGFYPVHTDTLFDPGDGLLIVRTRLHVWAWWASNDFPQPGPAQAMVPLVAKVQYEPTTGTDPNPPAGWPADPSTEEAGPRPVIWDALLPSATTYRPADAAAGTPQVFYQTATLLADRADSKAQRSFAGFTAAQAWVAIGQANRWDDTGSLHPIEFYACFTLQVWCRTAQRS